MEKEWDNYVGVVSRILECIFHSIAARSNSSKKDDLRVDYPHLDRKGHELNIRLTMSEMIEIVEKETELELLYEKTVIIWEL